MLLLASLLWMNFFSKSVFIDGTNVTRNNTMEDRTTLTMNRLLEGYDKRLRPNIGGPPCHVRVTIHVLSMVPIKEIDMEITAVFFFRQYWRDARLAYGASLGIPKLRLLGDILNQVWVPDTFFVNDQNDNPTRSDFLFEVTQDGDITYSARKKVSFYCPMNLWRFPMDTQECELVFESFAYSDEDVEYSWLVGGKQSLTISNDLQIPQYKLRSWDQISQKHYYSTGNFSSLAAKFFYKRNIGFYVLQNFIPTVLIVALSWVGFWIDEQSVPARVSLGITTILAITTLMFGVQTSLPKVGYVKAIDVFLLCSFMFVFAALVEYAIICTFTNVTSTNKVGVMDKRRLGGFTDEDLSGRKNKNTAAHENGNQEYIDHVGDKSFSSFTLTSSLFSRRKSSNLKTFSDHVRGHWRRQREPCAIDKHCRKLFPLAYILYLTIYFVVYTFIF